jgi:hypothetical protein
MKEDIKESLQFILQHPAIGSPLVQHAQNLARHITLEHYSVEPQVTDEQIVEIIENQCIPDFSEMGYLESRSTLMLFARALLSALPAAVPLNANPVVTGALNASEPAVETPKSTRMELVMQLREYANDSGYSHQDYADTMHMAADEIERFENIAIFMAAPQEAKPVAADVNPFPWKTDEDVIGNIYITAANGLRVATLPNTSRAAANATLIMRAIAATPQSPAKAADWVQCPICHEPDMRKEVDADGHALITCVNHGCASNGAAPQEQAPENKDGEYFRDVVKNGIQLHFEGEGDSSAVFANEHMVWAGGDRFAATRLAIDACLRFDQPQAMQEQAPADDGGVK